MERVSPKAAYRKAGVDLRLSEAVKSDLPRLLSSTQGREVLGRAGQFGALFAPRLRGLHRPVLVSSIDGVGTKLKVAFAMKKHDSIGQDLVNHCVNDILVMGADPLFFLDYLGTGKLNRRVFQEILQGLVRGCQENGCALIGGETAQMPGLYQRDEYDLCGTIIGMVDRKHILDGASVRPGDAIIGIHSNGLHTNGYSLARKILFERMRLKPSTRVAEFGTTVGRELLRTHQSYLPVIQPLLKKLNTSRSRGIKALAHITGGGFFENIPRMLPERCHALIRKNSWEIQPVFSLLQREGHLSEREMYRVFNMGIGMTLVVRDSRSDAVLRAIQRRGYAAAIIGEIARGERRVSLI